MSVLLTLVNAVIRVQNTLPYWWRCAMNRDKMNELEDWMRDHLKKLGLANTINLQFFKIYGMDCFSYREFEHNKTFVANFDKKIMLNHRYGPATKAIFLHEVGHVLLREKFEHEIHRGDSHGLTMRFLHGNM